MKKQNIEWLQNRPMWEVDKKNPTLLKNPTRWLSYANTPRSTPRIGWLDMASVVRATEIANSIKNRK